MKWVDPISMFPEVHRWACEHPLLVYGMGLVSAALILAFFWIWEHRAIFYSWIFALRNHRALGEPCKTDLVLDRRGYSLGYDFDHRAALWVSYILSKHSVSINVERSDLFYADPEIPEKFRVKPEDFKNTGYDKGHLAPSAAIDFSVRSNRETFAMSNIVFQHPKLNRRAWGKLEGIVRNWTERVGKIYVVTGPIFKKKPQKINGISVPSAFYKVIYAYRDQKCIGFVFPNQEISARDLWKHACSVRDVEKKTGMKFFKKKGHLKCKSKLELQWWRKV